VSKKLGNFTETICEELNVPAIDIPTTIITIHIVLHTRKLDTE
jgi:hypothetical protein